MKISIFSFIDQKKGLKLGKRLDIYISHCVVTLITEAIIIISNFPFKRHIPGSHDMKFVVFSYANIVNLRMLRYSELSFLQRGLSQ